MIYFKPLKEPDDWDWFVRRTSVIACADSQGIVAYDEKGITQAVCVFDTFAVDNCSVHFAIDNPFVIRHGFLGEIARHAFITRGRRRIFGLVPHTNEKSFRLVKHIGFTQVGRVPHGIAQGVDIVVFCLDKEDCRWIPEELRMVA